MTNLRREVDADKWLDIAEVNNLFATFENDRNLEREWTEVERGKLSDWLDDWFKPYIISKASELLHGDSSVEDKPLLLSYRDDPKAFEAFLDDEISWTKEEIQQGTVHKNFYLVIGLVMSISMGLGLYAMGLGGMLTSLAASVSLFDRVTRHLREPEQLDGKSTET